MPTRGDSKSPWSDPDGRRSSSEEAVVRRARFGDFELDLETGELRRGGQLVSLQAQVARTLLFLASRAGRVVLREELIRHLWPERIVEYDQGLNNLVRVLRRHLGDDAGRPRFIATIPRRGYRFVAPVEVVEVRAGSPAPEPSTREPAVAESGRGLRLALALSGLALAVAAVALLVASRRSVPDFPTLAVLPFSGTGPGTDVLGSSLAQELTRELSVVPGGSLRVIGHGSASRARRGEARPPAAGRLLGASHVVVGSVTDNGALLSLAVAVVRVEDGAELWRDDVATSWDELLTTQSALAREIAVRVGHVVGTGPQRDDPAIQPAAMEGYLRARYLASKSRWAEAVPLLRDVLGVESGFAPAQIALGEALLASSDDEAAAADARRLAELALRSSPGEARGHLLRARIALAVDWDWDLAEAHLERARELAAGEAAVHLFRAFYLSSLGKHREAGEAAELARKLDPLSATVQGDLAMLRFWAGDWPGVLRESERLLELEPEVGVARSLRLEALIRLRKWERARVLALSEYGEDAGLRSAVGAELGRRLLAIQEERWRDTAPGPTRAVVLASLAAQRGRDRDALRHLDEAVRLRSRYVPYLATDPHFSAIASEKEFQRLLARVRHPLARESPPPSALGSEP